MLLLEHKPCITGKNRIPRDEAGHFAKGVSGNPDGRGVGVKDKANQIKLAFFEAFERTGGIDELIKWIEHSKLNRREFYRLLMPLLPKDMNIEGDVGKDRVVVVQFGKLCAEPEISSGNEQRATQDTDSVR